MLTVLIELTGVYCALWMAWSLVKGLWNLMRPRPKGPTGLEIRDRLYEMEYGRWCNGNDDNWPNARRR